MLTERTRVWTVRQAGRDALSVAQVARELGVGWHTIMAAVLEIAGRLLADDDRRKRVTVLGLDEHNFLRSSYQSPTLWVTSFVDRDPGRLLDVVQDRTAMAVQRWIAAQPAAWRDGGTTAAIDPYQGYGTALHRLLPGAQVVVDHFHVIRLGMGTP